VLVEFLQQTVQTQHLQLSHQLVVDEVATVLQLTKHQVVPVEELVETTQQEVAEQLEQRRKVLLEVELLPVTMVVEVVVVPEVLVKTESLITLLTTEVAVVQV
jgi:hypothetical protein